MEQIKIKNKTYNIEEQIARRSYKLTRKNKEYFLKRFKEDSLELETFIEKSRELKISGISIPKIIAIDKKQNLVLTAFIAGPTALDVLIGKNLDNAYFEKIFEMAWYAEHDNITPDFHPEHWKLHDRKLYYLKFDYNIGYSKEHSFDLEGLRFWFYTKELVKYLESKGLPVDKSRIKDEYATNKEIVMCAYRYHL
ncbi:MAG: hypothetical protein LBM03_00265 [Erysipelotrichaceae bacterium]|jgi:tRNA A-37 threonylcarbamoyl transferase component Bud32|nr:hypothetical protein [Erysipelotrichaceae bacterium]